MDYSQWFSDPESETEWPDNELAATSKVLLLFYDFGDWQRDQVLKPKLLKWHAISGRQRQLLPWFEPHLDHLDECVTGNEHFCRIVAVAGAQQWGVPMHPSDPLAGWVVALRAEYDKTRSTLLQLAREWLAEGRVERDQAFGPILAALERLYPDREQRSQVKCLVPGSGLGRLVYELVARGFWTQGNELSYHMLQVLSLILNRCQEPEMFLIFPFIARSSHVSLRLNQIRPVAIPDVCPARELPDSDLMSITAGSFVDLYGPGLLLLEAYTQTEQAAQFRQDNKEKFDVVATCFFLDTASNIIDYLDTIYHTLKPDGRWINFGPLLWHFEDDKNAKVNVFDKPEPYGGLELARSELFDLCEAVGFEFEQQEHEIGTSYSGDPQSLGQFAFKCEFWVAKKRERLGSGQSDPE